MEGTGNMKTLIFILSYIMFLPAAYAKTPVIFSDVLEDGDVARVEFKVLDVEEPVFTPYRLNVTVKCVDRRSHKNSVHPRVQTVIQNVALCSYRPHLYNSGSKTITLQYSVAQTLLGEASCNDHIEQDINLAEVCEVWQK